MLGVAAMQSGCGWSSFSIQSLLPQAPELASIAVGPPDSNVAMGLTHQFIATGVYSDGSKLDLSSEVSWSSTHTAIASINSDGVATAISPGTTTVTASMGRLSGSTNLAVTAATLMSIGVTPTNMSLASGTTDSLRAIGVYSDNLTLDLTKSVTWSSSAPTIASVSNTAGANGMTIAVSPGSSMITATLGAVSGSTRLTVTAASLVSIGVTPTNPSIASGLTVALKATGVYTDNSIHDLTSMVTWSSSAPTVATVSNNAGTIGVSTAVSPGSSTITAMMGALSGSTTLTVTAASLVSIGVTPAIASIAVGLKTQFTAVGTYTDNSTQDITAKVVWTSSAPSLATVSNASGYDGLATALSPGPATITATLGTITGSTGLTVTPATLVSIGLTPANPSIAAGLTAQFVATGVYTDNSTQNLTTSVAWTSSDPTVAAVSNASGSNGLATALGQGSVTITASSGAVSGSTGLTVTPATLVSIAVTPANPSIANGTTEQFVATGTYTDNSTQNLTTAATWASSNPSLAAISNASGSNGLATALGQGSVTITATVGTISGSTGLTVTPATLVSIAVSPSNPGIANGTSQQFAAIGIYTDNSTHDVTTSVAWGSSDINVAAISNALGCNGLATALGQGIATITAALGSVSGSTGLTVTPATLVSIAVIPANPAIANGTNQQFAAIGTYTDNSTQPLTTSVSWNSSNSAVATISNASGSNGLTSAVAQGPVTITAILGGVSGSTGLTVTPATLVSIAVTPATASVADGTSQQFTATGTYTDGSTQNLTAAATWNSSDTTIASISNAAGSSGLATGLGVGSTSISAAVGTVDSSTVTLTVTADPEYVYATNQNGNTVSEYVIGAGGTLTSIGTVAAGSEPNAVAIDPTGGFVYVANWSGASLSQYAIGTGGMLTALGTIASGNEPASVTVGPTGQYVYAANLADNTVSQYTIGTGGVLTSLGTVAAGSSPISVTVDPTGQYAYVANENSSNVSEYAIGAGGALTSIGLAPTGNSPQYVTVDATDRYAYVANWSDNTVSEYTIGAGGTLTAIGAIATGNCPETVAVDPSSRYVYVENWCDASVSEYTIGAGGALSAIGTIATGSGPWFLTIDPSGRYVYVANFNSSTVSQYTIGAGGALTAVGTVATGNGPNAITAGY
ncbi:MAG: Ig-like domain-containing protein [Steroidobacteraceae bacterium]